MKSFLFSGALAASVVACTGPAREFPAETGSGGSGTTSTEAGPGSTSSSGNGGETSSPSSSSSSSSAGDGGSGVGGAGAGGPGQGGSGQGGSADGGGGGGGGVVSGLVLGIPEGPVVVRTEDSVVVEISVERTGPSEEPAVITVGTLPTGVTADDLSIPADQATGELTLHGAVGALQGRATLEITATADDLEDEATVELIVAGAPGSRDATFVNASGTYATQIGGARTRGRAVLVQPDGKIVVAGGTEVKNGGLMVAVRLDELGAPDADFAGGAGIFVGGPGQSQALAVALDPDHANRILLAGIAIIGFDGGSQLGVAAVTANGNTDVSFGNEGNSLSGVVSGWGQFRAVFPTPSGVIAMGENYISNDQHAVVYESTDDGDTLPRTHLFNGIETRFYGQQPDGKLVYGGRDDSNSMTITRLSAPNTLDSSFNFSGTQAVFFSGRVAYATGFDVDDTGRILLGGYSEASGEARISLAKLNSNGTPVATFGVGGELVSGIAMRTQSSDSVVVDSQGRILFGGYVGTAATTPTPAVARFNPDGTADETFGTGGLVVLDDLAVVAGNDWQSVWGITVDDLDRVIVTGDFGDFGTSSLFVTRLWF